MLALQQYEAARAAYAEEIAAGNAHADCYSGRGVATMALGDSGQAVADFDRALLIDNAHWEARYYRALCRFYLGRPEDALADLDLLAEGPEHIAVLTDRGGILCKLGRHTEALPDLERALQLNPTAVPVHANLGSALAQLGRYANAIPHYAVAAAAGVPQAADALDRARQHTFVDAVGDGAAEAAIVAFQDALTADDLRAAIRRWPVLANPYLHQVLAGRIDELPLEEWARRAASRTHLDLLLRLTDEPTP